MARPLKTKTSEEVEKAFKDIIKNDNSGIYPDQICLDAGTEFSKLKLLCKNQNMHILIKKLRNKCSFAENEIKNVKRRLYMALRHNLEKKWHLYLQKAVNSCNNNFMQYNRKITPALAHNDKSKYDVLIRNSRKNSKNPVTYASLKDEQKESIRKYLKSPKSVNKRPGDYVYIPTKAAGSLSKGFDVQVMTLFTFIQI